MLYFLDLLAAVVLDWIFGDPYKVPHPVTFIGKLARLIEKGLLNNNYETNNRKLLKGLLLTILVVSSTSVVVWGTLRLGLMVSPVLFHIINIYILYTSLASTCMAKEALKTYSLLKKSDLPGARKQLGMLVGRETHELNEKEIIRGVVETTAENTVDGVISPLIYAFIGSFFGLGAVFAYCFKAASTLDSMVGYKNEKYLYFGRASARLDDILNYIPARVTGILMPVAALFTGLDMKNSFRIMLRDRKKHTSPNCAWSEAAAAGALGVQIGGSNVYFGKVVEKPTIGDQSKPLEIKDIVKTVQLLYSTEIAAIIIMGTVLLIRTVFN